MIAVIFEVIPQDGRMDDYLKVAASMRDAVREVEGFISVERFQSITDPSKLLSVSFFENEAAVERWRNVMAHREAQAAGRGELFADYRLRVAHVLRDYGKNERTDAPGDSRAAHG
jgi:heme-degrading monooxygenase HmoA